MNAPVDQQVRYGKLYGQVAPLMAAAATAADRDDVAAWHDYAHTMAKIAALSRVVWRDDPAMMEADRDIAALAALLLEVARAHREGRPRQRGRVPAFEAIPRAAQTLDAMAGAQPAGSRAALLAGAFATLAEVTRMWRLDPAVAAQWRVSPAHLEHFATLYRRAPG